MSQMNELGFFTLAGAPESPRELVAEVRQAEGMGFGSVFVSERLNIKEAATLSGAVGVISERMGVATAATNHHTQASGSDRGLRHDHAHVDRRSFLPRSRQGCVAVVQSVRSRTDHDFSDGGFCGADASALAR